MRMRLFPRGKVRRTSLMPMAWSRLARTAGQGAYGSMYRVDPGAGIDILPMIQMPQATGLGPRYFTAVHQAFVQDAASTRQRQSTTEFQPSDS